ncbi:MAG: porin [Nevskia sp.]
MFVGSGASGVAMADTATTNGGILIKTDDGKFEAKIGGRIQLDANFIETDKRAKFGSGTAAPSSGLYFRRVYLTVTGKLYGWDYKIEPDFSSNNDSGATGIAFQDLYIGHEIGPGKLILGQRKPYRGLEELISSNEVTFIERPTASAVGIFGGGASREFQLGAYYEGQLLDNNFTYGTSIYNLRRENTISTEGFGTNGRLTWSPIHADKKVIHVGGSISYEVPHNNGSTFTPQIIGSQSVYAGRRGPSIRLGLAGADEPVTTFGVEGGGVYGPLYVSGEYFNQNLSQDTRKDQTVTSYYVQASYFLTGESKPYKAKDGIFGSPKVNNPWGALEAAVRYESSKNEDTTAGCPGAPNATTGAYTYAVGGTKCETSALLFGLNYYVNPNVRFLFNYIIAEADQGGTLGKDKPHTVALRAQLSF